MRTAKYAVNTFHSWQAAHIVANSSTVKGNQMATTSYFDEAVKDQGGEHVMDVEFGRSSYYSGSPLKDGRTGEDSIYLKVNGKTVIMDRATAKLFVEAAISVGHYHGLID